MSGFLSFFDSPTVCLILWFVCAVCFFVFKDRNKEKDEDIYKKAEEVNKDSLSRFILSSKKKRDMNK